MVTKPILKVVLGRKEVGVYTPVLIISSSENLFPESVFLLRTILTPTNAYPRIEVLDEECIRVLYDPPNILVSKRHTYRTIDMEKAIAMLVDRDFLKKVNSVLPQNIEVDVDGLRIGDERYEFFVLPMKLEFLFMSAISLVLGDVIGLSIPKLVLDSDLEYWLCDMVSNVYSQKFVVIATDSKSLIDRLTSRCSCSQILMFDRGKVEMYTNISTLLFSAVRK